MEDVFVHLWAMMSVKVTRAQNVTFSFLIDCATTLNLTKRGIIACLSVSESSHLSSAVFLDSDTISASNTNNPKIQTAVNRKS